MTSTPQQHTHIPAYRLRDERTGRHFLVRNHPSNIDMCIALSYARCILSMLSILLAITDIPRTGLAVDGFAHFPSVAPGKGMYYGPYAYPTIHLNKTGNCSGTDSGCDIGSISGYSGDTLVESVDLWAYKFDSLSIPTRALAEHLNVSTYPACLFYDTPCRESTLTPDTVFTMLNDLLTKIHAQYFDGKFIHKGPLVFKTLSYWADRLHHVLLGTIGYRIDDRIHSVHHYAVAKSLRDGSHLGVDVCSTRRAIDRHRPMLCDLEVQWLCDHPTLGAETQIPIHESIHLRFSTLQQQYPDTQLDLTLISTKFLMQSHKSAFLPTVFYSSDNPEITTLIRGRKCRPEKTCTVEFLDDYRYERATIESSADEIIHITGTLRAASQLYVWLRVLLLGFVCCQSRLAEASHRSKSIVGKLRVVGLTLLKIPSHTLIYSSWFPVVGYSLAHAIDCGIVHFISDNFWSSANGWLAFDFFSYVVVASIQMRNIWLIALFWKCASTIYTSVFLHRFQCWRPRHGVRAFRGVFVGMTSLLTIFSFLRTLRFRNTKVLRFHEVSHHAGPTSLHFPPISNPMSDFGFLLDLKTTLVASGLVGTTGLLMQTFLRAYFKSNTNFFTCHNHYVPGSAGKLFPSSTLNVFWYIRVKPRASSAFAIPWIRAQPLADNIRHLSSRLLNAVLPAGEFPHPRRCDVCNFPSTLLNWRPMQGCLRHESLFSVGARSVETQSVVRLMNIGMLSDPIVFVRLRLLGRPLYLYRARNRCATWLTQRGSNSDEAGLSPVAGPAASFVNFEPNDSFVLAPAVLSDKMGQSRHHADGYDLVAVVSSKLVPWTLLADCG